MKFLTFPTIITLKQQMQAFHLISLITGMQTTLNTLAFLILFIYSNIFKSFCNPFNTQINMDIATSCGSSWLSVGDLWSYSFDAARNLMNNLESGDYPLTITIKQYEQLLRVYETCISPSQFIPLLINDTNR